MRLTIRYAVREIGPPLKITSPSASPPARLPGSGELTRLAPGDKIRARILGPGPAGKTLLQIGTSKILTRQPLNGKIGDIILLEVQPILQAREADGPAGPGFRFRQIEDARPLKRLVARATPSGKIATRTGQIATRAEMPHHTIAMSPTRAPIRRPSTETPVPRGERHRVNAEAWFDFSGGFWIESIADRPRSVRVDLKTPHSHQAQNKDGRFTASLELDLEHTGAIMVDLQMDTNSIRVDFGVARTSTLAKIETHLTDLQKALEPLGCKVFCKVQPAPERLEGAQTERHPPLTRPRPIELKI